MLTIDGASGEGGGQVLRTALALSLITDRPVRLTNIRAGRSKPGLMRQHLTAVQAAQEIGRASVEGAAVGSTEIRFRPGATRGGAWTFSVGSAGSTTLVLQTVLPALMLAPEQSSLVLEGGTHNPKAPAYDFLARAFLPLVRRMGPTIEVTLERPGFYPAGGGRLRVSIQPSAKLAPFELRERGALRLCTATALVAALPTSIAQRELHVIARRFGWGREHLRVENAAARGPGNALCIEIESENVTEVFTAFGARGVAAEAVAEGAATEAEAYLRAGVPVGQHLADQLLLPLALAGGGAFRSLPPSSHTRTQAEVIRAFLGVETRMEEISEHVWEFEVRR
jgi:RNA 3'-terminal phosphate cyclase (ATP)